MGTSTREARYSSALSGELIEKWIWHNQLCYQTIRASATNLIVVESKAIAETERNLFKTVWNIANPTVFKSAKIKS